MYKYKKKKEEKRDRSTVIIYTLVGEIVVFGQVKNDLHTTTKHTNFA
jgi:hypothetical protein